MAGAVAVVRKTTTTTLVSDVPAVLVALWLDRWTGARVTTVKTKEAVTTTWEAMQMLPHPPRLRYPQTYWVFFMFSFA